MPQNPTPIGPPPILNSSLHPIHVNAVGSSNPNSTNVPTPHPTCTDVVYNPVTSKSTLADFGFEHIPDDYWISQNVGSLNFSYVLRYDVKHAIQKFRARILLSSDMPKAVKKDLRDLTSKAEIQVSIPGCLKQLHLEESNVSLKLCFAVF